MADNNLALFFDRVILIVKYARQGITEDGEGFPERHSVLGNVGCGPFPVPLEGQVHCESGTYHWRVSLEPAAEIEEVGQGQLPAREEIGSEDLIARERCVQQVLLPL
jgi:hypothetical protein